ncbi:MAG: tRNA (guanosine(37)-N1)-methyltransferase TrmD [Chloroflexi bacterium]|nr:tRNA (guanosine(37)-N1)-methyltransferase TrmD [Chloroflexota bacterium]
MHIDIITLFPHMFQGPFEEGILRRAREKGLLSIALHDLRAFGVGKHRQVDDVPYGGAPGMLLRPEPIVAAVESILDRPVFRGADTAVEVETLPPIILLTPQGRPLTQAVVKELARHDRLVLICGRYEGVDERVREFLVTDEISIGDYVLSGGELAAMVLVDAVTRVLPGALGYERGAEEDSFASGLLEGPQYTRPPEFRGRQVPDVLLSGHHERIAAWRRDQALKRTRERRPDLLEKRTSSEDPSSGE